MGLIVVRNRPPSHRCEVCKTPLYEDEYVPHMRACVRRNEDEIRGASAREQLDAIFGDDAGDSEFRRWVRDNRRALAEDRLRM